MQQSDPRALAELAARVRFLGLEMVHGAASGHLGGSFSAADILVSLYFRTIKIYLNNDRNTTLIKSNIPSHYATIWNPIVSLKCKGNYLFHVWNGQTFKLDIGIT